MAIEHLSIKNREPKLATPKLVLIMQHFFLSNICY